MRPRLVLVGSAEWLERSEPPAAPRRREAWLVVLTVAALLALLATLGRPLGAEPVGADQPGPSLLLD